MPIALIAHGGAGNWRNRSEEHTLEGMRSAIAKGRAVLEAAGSALDAACAAVVALEDNPLFNAGTGATLNVDGFCELDASVMVSREMQVGAVCALQRVRNPILVARKVMEETDHVMLTGEGAQRFARVMGFPDYDPITLFRQTEWLDNRKRIDEVLGKHALKTRRFLKEHPEYAGGTVGAVAVDSQGTLVAATSTGGATMKLVGRVGDSPLPGAGNYASSWVAASATGTGEFVMRTLATRAIADSVEHGVPLAAAIRAMLDRLGREFDADVGFVAVDRQGVTSAAHRTPDMPHGFFEGHGEVVVRMRSV